VWSENPTGIFYQTNIIIFIIIVPYRSKQNNISFYTGCHHLGTSPLGELFFCEYKLLPNKCHNTKQFWVRNCNYLFNVWGARVTDNSGFPWNLELETPFSGALVWLAFFILVTNYYIIIINNIIRNNFQVVRLWGAGVTHFANSSRVEYEIPRILRHELYKWHDLSV